MKPTDTNYFEVNKATWNQKVEAHTASDFYDLEGFTKGRSSLQSFELEALGDVNGKSLLHLQCHFGQDTLSWARMGAQCTGVDISDKGIAFAKALSKKIQTPARFVCCNVLDTSAHISEHFDIVYTSYGTIGWLPDLAPWALMIAQRLKKGGTFYIVDFHPIVWMFDYTSGKPLMRYGYNQEEVIYEEYQGTYADTENQMTSKEYGWNHGMAEIITALLEAGLQLDFFREHHESPYDILPDLLQKENGHYVTSDRLYPLLFELQFSKI